MSVMFMCNKCGKMHPWGEACPQLDSIVTPRMASQSNPEQDAQIRALPPTGERKISELMDDLMNVAKAKGLYPEGTSIQDVLNSEAEKTAR